MNTPMGAPAKVARELGPEDVLRLLSYPASLSCPGCFVSIAWWTRVHQAMDILGQWDSNPARKDKKMRSGESVSGPPPAAERQCRLCDFIL